MRISVVIDSPDKAWRSTPALSAAGHQVTLEARLNDSEPGTTAGSVRVHQVSGGVRSAKAIGRFADSLVDHWRAAAPDVVHIVSTVAAAAAIPAAAVVGVPVVYEAEDQPGPIDDTALFAAVDHVIVPYNRRRTTLLRAGVRRDTISVVPYGVDLDHFTPDGNRADMRKQHRIVAMGTLNADSGFGTAVAALTALRDTELVIVGGPARGSYAGKLRAYARSLGVANRLVLAGAVPHDALPSLLRSADLVVCTPRTASFGTAAITAMACGVAVVANGVGGLTDTVVHGITGVHVPPNRPRELAMAVRTLLSQRGARGRFGASGRDRAEARYSWPFIADQTTHAYHRAVESAGNEDRAGHGASRSPRP